MHYGVLLTRTVIAAYVMWSLSSRHEKAHSSCHWRRPLDMKSMYEWIKGYQHLTTETKRRSLSISQWCWWKIRYSGISLSMVPEYIYVGQPIVMKIHRWIIAFNQKSFLYIGWFNAACFSLNHKQCQSMEVYTITRGSATPVYIYLHSFMKKRD